MSIPLANQHRIIISNELSENKVWLEFFEGLQIEIQISNKVYRKGKLGVLKDSIENKPCSRQTIPFDFNFDKISNDET